MLKFSMQKSFFQTKINLQLSYPKRWIAKRSDFHAHIARRRSPTSQALTMTQHTRHSRAAAITMVMRSTTYTTRKRCTRASRATRKDPVWGALRKVQLIRPAVLSRISILPPSKHRTLHKIIWPTWLYKLPQPVNKLSRHICGVWY